jgi:hypothetical protein
MTTGAPHSEGAHDDFSRFNSASSKGAASSLKLSTTTTAKITRLADRLSHDPKITDAVALPARSDGAGIRTAARP